MGGKKMMEIVDPPQSHSIKPNSNLYILCEGFKYTLRQWRRWTHDAIEVYNYEYDDDLCETQIITRGEYAMAFVSEIDEVLYNNGYLLKHSVDSIARRFMHYWMQIYKSNGWNVQFPVGDECKKNVDMEEWEVIFSEDFWKSITEPYIVQYGFDDTPIGKALLANVGWFFWTYIDGKNSSRIIAKRKEEMELEKEIRKWREESDGGSGGKTGGLVASKEHTHEDINEKAKTISDEVKQYDG